MPRRNTPAAAIEDSLPKHQQLRFSVGRSWPSRLTAGKPLHAVVSDDEFGWVALCSGTRATREYIGFRAAVTCAACRRLTRD